MYKNNLHLFIPYYTYLRKLICSWPLQGELYIKSLGVEWGGGGFHPKSNPVVNRGKIHKFSALYSNFVIIAQ